jgi:cytochrome c oxidase subunit II
MGHRFSPRAVAPLFLLALTAILLSGCEHLSSPQNTFNPAGKVADGQKDDFLLVTYIALPIMILVLAACVVIPVMFRQKKGDPGLPKQVHGNTALELTWTIIPALLLAVIAVPTVAGIRDLGREPSAEALEVRVRAQQFLFEFHYREILVGDEPLESPPDTSGERIVGVLRIPVGREIALRLVSQDVIHSFWVPKLAGKTDVVPNHENKMWIRADEPGTYEGQCAEFCGLSHSDMRFRVIAMPQAEFDAWVSDQGGVETLGSADSTAADDDEEPTNGDTPPPPPGAIILEDNVVRIEGQDGENPTITVPSGDVVTVLNKGRALHNLQVSPFDATICELDDEFDSPCTDPNRISAGDEGTITFDVAPGEYEYRCDFHPTEMLGTLVVGPAEPGGDAPSGEDEGETDGAGAADADEADEPAGD